MKIQLLVAFVSCLASGAAPGNAQATETQHPVSPSGSTAVTSPMDCPAVNAEHLKASYRVSSHGQETTAQLQLLRNGERFIVQRSGVSFEAWNQHEYVRYFPAEKRSVTYNMGDLRALNIRFDLQQLYHLVSPQLLTQMHKTNETQHGCLHTQGYQGMLANGEGQQLRSKLEWLEAEALPYAFSVEGPQGLRYELQEIVPLSASEFDTMTQGFEEIDFADVGDSESDPFIAKMIHQGFIQHGSAGFYHSDGRTMAAETQATHSH